MTTAEVTQLRELHDQIRQQAEILAAPATRTLQRSDGSTTSHPEPSLLGQLRDALGHGTRDKTGGATRPGMPVAVDVVDLQQRIEAELSRWCRMFNLRRRGLEASVKAVAAAAGQLTDTEQLHQLSAALIDWARCIQTVLNPPRRMHLAAACPACDVRTVYRPDPNTGQNCPTPALQIDGQNGCYCLNCAHMWPTTHFEHLASVLGCRPLPE